MGSSSHPIWFCLAPFPSRITEKIFLPHPHSLGPNKALSKPHPSPKWVCKIKDWELKYKSLTLYLTNWNSCIYLTNPNNIQINGMVTRNLTIYLSFLILEYTNTEQNKRKREFNVGWIIEQCGKLLCLLTIKLKWDSKCNIYIYIYSIYIDWLTRERFCPRQRNSNS